MRREMERRRASQVPTPRAPLVVGPGATAASLMLLELATAYFVAARDANADVRRRKV